MVTNILTTEFLNFRMILNFIFLCFYKKKKSIILLNKVNITCCFVLWTNYLFIKCQTCQVPIYKPVLQDGLNGAPCFVIPVSLSSDLFLKGWTVLCGVWHFYTGGTVQCFSLVDFVSVFKSSSLYILKHLHLQNPLKYLGTTTKVFFFNHFVHTLILK